MCLAPAVLSTCATQPLPETFGAPPGCWSAWLHGFTIVFSVGSLSALARCIVGVAPANFPPRCEHLPPQRIERSDQRVDVLNRWLVHAADPEPGWRQAQRTNLARSASANASP